jgi:hypothetical protein
MAATKARAWRSCALGILLAGYTTSLLAVCDAPRLAANVPTDKHPRLTWQAVEGASSYRVRVQSRIPDGLVIATHDTAVSKPEFLAPQPLTQHRAKVTVRLNAICGAETSADAVSVFMIDTSAVCKLGEVDAAFEGGTATLKWRPVAGARSYEVRAHALDGRFLVSQETRDAASRVALKETAVVSVRPACAAGLGEAVYRVVAAR